mmetsp:Transcript_17967/g.39457  ORF Transcript_17967/g.39457 Transcript_17967/m.39457 type:complete len:215 (-) Transcript_17967:75-719(-)
MGRRSQWRSIPGSIFVVVATAAASSALLVHLLAAHAAWAASTEGRGQRKVDVLLAVEADEEGGDIADLLAHADMPLANQGARVVHRLRQAQLEDLGLQAALHDLGRGETEHVVQLLLVLGQQAESSHPPQERLALEDALLALLLQGEQGSGRSADLRQGVLHTPDLTLVLEAVLPDNFHLCIQALLLEGPLRLTEGLAVVLVALLAHLVECRRS